MERSCLFRWGCTLFLALGFIHQSSYASSSLTQQITKSDQLALEQFFQLLLKRGSLGYTLFGEKPMSMAVFLNLEHSTDSQISEYLILEKGWQAWLNNKHLFPNEHFTLIRVKEKTLSFHLINKKQALKKIQEHLDLFQTSKTESPETILSKICASKRLKTILTSDELLGILFGYGEKNSRNFEESTNLLRHIGRHMIPPFSQSRVGKNLDPETKNLLAALFSRKKHNSSGAPLMQKDIDSLNEFIETRQTFNLGIDAPYITQFCSPGFCVWDENEAKKLEESYGKTLARMKEAYQTGSFLEKTLQQWIDPK